MLAAVLLSVAQASVGARAMPSVPRVPATDAEDGIEEAVEIQSGFRRQIGFRSDEEYVRELNRRPEAYHASADPLTTYGYPMTGPERAELGARQRLEGQASRVHEYGEEHPSVFAGSYLDHRAGGILRVGFTEGVEEHTRRLAARLSAHPERLQGFQAARSYASLSETQRQLRVDRDTLREIGVEVVSTGINVERNVVLVGVVDLTDAKRTQLTQRYGAAIETTERARGSRQHFPHADHNRATTFTPLRGGLRLDDVINNWICTSGNVAWDVTGMALQVYLLTAGHCYEMGDPVFQGVLRTIGNVERRAFVDGGQSDALAIRIDPAEASRWLYVHPGAQAWQLRRFQLEWEDEPGHIACIAAMQHPGEHQQQVCGVIEEVDADFTTADASGTFTTTETRRVTFGAQGMCAGGDSGGAWYAGDVAFGILTGGDGESCWYSHIHNALQELGLQSVWIS